MSQKVQHPNDPPKNHDWPKCSPDKKKCPGVLLPVQRAFPIQDSMNAAVSKFWKCSQCQREVI